MKEDRDSKVRAIRPQLDLDSSLSGNAESFQNQTLRPILKLQHQLTLALLRQSKFKHLSSDLNQNIFEEKLKDFISKDAVFKHTLIGMMLGMFNSEELEFYFLNAKECRKRIVSMQLKRYVDTQYSK